MRLTALFLTMAVMLCLVIGPLLASPDPPAWSSFIAATYEGVDLVPSEENGLSILTLTLQPGATVDFGTGEYQINWIQSFFLVAIDESTTFTATDGGMPSDWKWESKPSPGQIAGWVGNEQVRVYPVPGSSGAVQFKFNELEYTPGTVLAGFHIGYGTGTDSAWFKSPAGPLVPEPSSLIALLSGVGGMCGIALRRKKA